MDFLIDRAKEIFWLIATAIATALSPVHNVLVFLSMAFFFNIVMGIITDVNVRKQRFSMTKAWKAVKHLLFYFACVVFIDYGCRLLGDADMAKFLVKWLTYIVIYFYFTNIFKNAKQIFPDNKAIRFIYELLSTEIFDRLKNILGYKHPNNNNDESN